MQSTKILLYGEQQTNSIILKGFFKIVNEIYQHRAIVVQKNENNTATY
jgi:hypothetical protein